MTSDKNLAKLRRYFNTSGKRYTVEREHMLDVIAAMKGRFTIVELFKAAKAKGYVHAASTLYRNLYIFIDSGFITELHLSGNRVEYEANTGQNSFILCVGCGELKKVRFPKGFKAMQDEVCKRHKMMPVAYSYQMKGYCAKCQKKIAK
jgi:Fe2+ or Zn2+ uptake regulation protein